VRTPCLVNTCTIWHLVFSHCIPTMLLSVTFCAFLSNPFCSFMQLCAMPGPLPHSCLGVGPHPHPPPHGSACQFSLSVFLTYRTFCHACVYLCHAVWEGTTSGQHTHLLTVGHHSPCLDTILYCPWWSSTCLGMGRLWTIQPCGRRRYAHAALYPAVMVPYHTALQRRHFTIKPYLNVSAFVAVRGFPYPSPAAATTCPMPNLVRFTRFQRGV